MKNKGFTLIEMIAVVILISLIALISLPTLTNQLVDKKGEVSEATLEIINNAAELYMTNKQTEYPKGIINKGASYCISLDTLVSTGNLRSPIKDFKTGEEVPLTKYVKVTINEFGEYSFADDLVDMSC